MHLVAKRPTPGCGGAIRVDGRTLVRRSKPRHATESFSECRVIQELSGRFPERRLALGTSRRRLVAPPRRAANHSRHSNGTRSEGGRMVDAARLAESGLARGNAKYNEDEQRFYPRVRRSDAYRQRSSGPGLRANGREWGSGVGANKRAGDLNVA
jgi:hypothetical protein